MMAKKLPNGNWLAPRCAAPGDPGMAGDGFVEVAPDDRIAIRWQQWYDAHPEEDPRAYEQPPELDDEDNTILDRLWDNMPDEEEADQVSASRPARKRNKAGVLPLTSESRPGPTPNGGVKSVMYYLDDNRRPVDKSSATRTEIVEYDANDNAIFRTYGTLTPSPQVARSKPKKRTRKSQ